MEKNTNQQLVDELHAMDLAVKQRRAQIAKIATSDNYLEEMKKINSHLNQTRKNKNTVSYAKLKNLTLQAFNDAT